MTRHESMPAAEYHKAEGYGGTSIARWDTQTPLEWDYQRQNGILSTDFMERGTLSHTLVLEPEELDAQHYVMGLPHGRRSNAEKAAWLAFAHANRGKVIVTSTALPEDHGVLTINPVGFEAAFAGARLVRRDAEIYSMIQRGRREVSYFQTHPVYGIQLKARLDWEGPTGVGAAAMDLKGVRDISLRFLRKRVYDMRYFVQAAHYMNVVEMETGERPRAFYLLWLKNSPPVDLRVTELSASALEQGRLLANRAYSEIAACMAKGSWPGCPRKIEKLELPTYHEELHDNPEHEEETE